MNMRKIIAVLAAALMLCSIIPMGAMVSAADAVYSEDFEDGTLGTWSSSSGGVANLVAAADLPVANPNGGNYAMQTVVNPDKYPYLVDSTSFNVEANTDYVIKVDVLHTASNWPVSVIIGGTSWLSDPAFNSGSVNVSNAAWTTLTFIFNTGDKTKVYMGVKSNWANCTVYFDNFSVAKADAASVGTSDGHIYNGDFETGAADPWSIGSNAQVVADPTGSGRGYVMQSDEAGSGAALFSQVANNLKANTYYKLSFKVYNYNTATNNAFWVRFPSTVTDWSVDLSAASGMTSQSVNAYTPRINVLGKTGAWYDLAITFNTGDLTSVLISFLNYRSGAGQYYFDNIKVREVKDPSFDGYITNGDFETGDLNGWTVTGANIAEENGNYIVQGTSTVKYKNFVHQIVTVEPNTEYAISFKAKAAVSGGQARLYAGTGTGNTGYKNANYYWTPKTDAWTTYTTSFNSGDATELYINLCQGINDGGDIYYDDILMWELKDPSYDGYIYNGDFETGVAGNWKLSQSTAINATAAKDGTFGAQLIGSGWGGLLGYTFAVEEGHTYQLTYDAKAVTAGFNSTVLVDTWEGEKLATKTVSATEWTTYTLEFTAASNQCYFNMNGYSSSASVDCYVDNVKVVDVTPAACEHAYDNACDADCNLCGEVREVAGHNYVGEETQAPTCGDAGEMTYTCQNCGDSYTEAIAATGEHSYFYPCDIVCQVCFQETNPDATHNVVHVEALEPTCTALGNIEYWYCADCGAAWADEALTQVTNPMSVKLPMVEHEYFYPCDPVCMNCYEITNEGATHNIVAVEAVEATCTENGNIAYWYCADCGAAWADEALTQVTNRFSVVLPATGEHTYANDYDVDCDVCGGIREVELPVATGGTSASEDVSGVAALFNVGVEGLAIKEGTATEADLTNATVNGYKLISMGAIASNGTSEVDVPVVYMYELNEEATSYAIRVKNIPDTKYDVEITFTPYVVIEIDGEQVTLYGEAQAASYNGVLG